MIVVTGHAHCQAYLVDCGGEWPPYGVVRLINFGQPYIVVEDGDYKGRRELYLKHYHDGKDLDVPHAEKTLQYVYQIWGHPVHLESRAKDSTVIFTCDGGKVERVVH